MLTDIRVIRRALERDVESDLDAELAGLGDEPAEVLERSEFGLDGLMSALLAADRPRAARIACRAACAVVRTLPLRDANRMDGRQIQYVEAHRRDFRQQCLHVRECAVFAGPRRRRTRK